ncbi:TonB-dependent receptor [Duganella sp. FT94W]|uniref:TonB-dependent receptor n=1 Tax=Duganella lactea TaxID=2692173 RepID=A0ABW9V5V3_9BURK|nr:TonB-dependent receptor [Duganella lactea]MYM34963.1 TonB-dependent receptor [Duganella lactea]
MHLPATANAASTHRLPLRPALLAALLGTAFSADAQQEPATVEVRGSADAYDARRDDTASKIVVRQEDLLKYGDTSVVEALKRVPGVTVSGSGRNSEVRMRGLGSGYTQILIDGERAPTGFSIDSLSPEVIERIEVMRVAVAEFSTQAIAGTINIVLKKAVKPGQRSFKLGHVRGAAANTPDASLQLSDRRGRLAYSLSASASRPQSSEHSRTLERLLDADGNVTGLRGIDTDIAYDSQFLTLTPRLTWTFAEGDTLTSQTVYNFYRYKSDAFSRDDILQGPDTSLTPRAQQRDSIWRMLREELNWVHKFGGGVKLDAKLSGMYTRVSTNANSTGVVPGAPAFTVVEPADGWERGVTTVGKLSSTASAGHVLAVGWDAGHSTHDAVNYKRRFPVPGRPPIDDERYALEVSRAAFYAQDEWSITPRWSLYLGARWEGILVRTEGNTFDTAHARSRIWSPLLQTLYKLPGDTGQQLRFALSRTSKAPTLLSLLPLRFASTDSSQFNPDLAGNPNLRPEIAVGFDAGYEHHWKTGGLWSVSVSQRRIRDYTRNVLTFADGRWTSMPVNSGDATTRGLELEAKLPLKALIDTGLALNLNASLSRNWSTVDAVPGPDNRLDAQTPLSATLGADYTSGRLTTGGTFVFKNGGHVRVLRDQALYQSVRRDLDLYALWQFNPRLQLRLAASNLLAQDRERASDFVFPGAGSQHTQTLTPSHRSVRATLQMKF